MNTLKPLLFLLLATLLTAGSCTSRNDSAEHDEIRKWSEAYRQLTDLRKKKRTDELIGSTHRQLAEMLRSTSTTPAKDSLVYYMRRMIVLCQTAYLTDKRYKAGIEYMDSLSRIPFMQEHYRRVLLCNLACLNQMCGNNREAIRLADEYLALPPCPDPDEFIRQSENVSSVYFYSGNDLPRAIQILEKAMEAYRKGGKYPQMTRLISRLGIYYRLKGEYEKAVATNQEAISSYDESMPPSVVVIAYGEQANLFAELGMYDHALQMNQKAQHYSMLQDSFGLGDLYRYRAEIFRKTHRKDSVFHYLRLGEKLSALQKSFKGVFVNKVGQADACLDYPDSVGKALQLLHEIAPDTFRMPPWAKYLFNLNLGRALMKTGEEKRGAELMERASEGFAEMNMMEQEHSTNRQLIDYYFKTGETGALVRCFTRNRQFVDSLSSIEKLRAVAAANIRFETLQKEKENKLLSAQVQWQEKQLFYNICISVALLLLLTTATGYFIIRRKAHRQLIENNKREIGTLITRQQELNRRNEQLAEEIERAMATNNLNSVRRLTGQSLLSKEDENIFRQSFANIYPSYLPKLREIYPQLTRNEELLAMLICMNQSTDEIALIMGINRNSVNVVRSRMRKNMELPKEKSLDEVLRQYLT